MNPHRRVAFNLRITGGEGETQDEGCGAFVGIELQDEVQSDGGVASSSIYPQTFQIFAVMIAPTELIACVGLGEFP